jgi:protein-S-isoprenylcysteine O-methyltransferase Ste14
MYMDWLTKEWANSAIRIGWIAFVLFWIWMSRRVKRTAWRESIASRLSYSSLIMAGALTLFLPLGKLDGSMLPGTPLLWGAAVLLNSAGILFAIRARVILGTNWSASVTVKEGHELIQSGPYRFVRHPIYTGILVSWLGIVLAVDRWKALIGFALVFVAFLIKSRLEERRMMEQFGAKYEEYRRTTSALIPHVI